MVALHVVPAVQAHIRAGAYDWHDLLRYHSSSCHCATGGAPCARLELLRCLALTFVQGRSSPRQGRDRARTQAADDAAGGAILRVFQLARPARGACVIRTSESAKLRKASTGLDRLYTAPGPTGSTHVLALVKLHGAAAERAGVRLHLSHRVSVVLRSVPSMWNCTACGMGCGVAFRGPEVAETQDYRVGVRATCWR